MKSIKKYLMLFTICTTVLAQNNYPIVLVHGFMGWGPEEMLGYKYWGGFWNIEKHLKKQGFIVYTVSVGPVSSNWERAVETFYQLKGGQLDYGKAHSDRFGVIQKPEGKSYKALYPEWDSEHPVHFIGHSMGGQTIRMLDYLLTNQFYSDSARTIVEESKLLREKHDGWIKSITTISSPHNGTTYIDVRIKEIPFIQNLLGFAAVVGSRVYNFDLEHWDLKQKKGESWNEYYNRMQNHPAWNSKNVSTWDLSISGAREMNTYVRANPNIYYFSFANTATILDENTGFHIPGNKNINKILRNKAENIGSTIGIYTDSTETDSTWFENDGVVNTISMAGPTTGLNGSDKIIKYSKDRSLIPGQWYTLGPYQMGHYYIIGQAFMRKKSRDKLYKIYSDHCKLLYTLPK